MVDRMNIHPLYVAVVAFLLAAAESCHIQPSHADAWTAQEVALGQLCWNEGSTSRSDCIAIVQARGSYSLERLRSAHRRALNPNRTDDRRWIAGLNAAGTMPPHWPESRVPWQRGSALWTEILTTVRATLAGSLSVCDERPQVWGSRTLDADRLARIHARGGREVCRGTRNAFVRFGGER